MSTFAIIDFETTGLSPDYGDRATEIAAVVIEGQRVVARYQSLINPKRPIPAYVQQLTGITDVMVRSAPGADQVMRELHQCIGSIPLVAHNASFDQRFLDTEYKRAGLRRQADFTCSMLLARRLYPGFPTHKLGDLVRRLNLPSSGVYHRAMADAEMTTHLLMRMLHDLGSRGLHAVPHKLLQQLQRIPKCNVDSFIARHCR